MTRRQKRDTFFALGTASAIVAYHNSWIDGMFCFILVMIGLALIVNPGPPHHREGDFQ